MVTLMFLLATQSRLIDIIEGPFICLFKQLDLKKNIDITKKTRIFVKERFQFKKPPFL